MSVGKNEGGRALSHWGLFPEGKCQGEEQTGCLKRDAVKTMLEVCKFYGHSTFSGLVLVFGLLAHFFFFLLTYF